MIVTPVTLSDKAAWLPLWQAYLAFYRQSLPEEITDLTFARFLDDAEPMGMVVAKEGEEMLGFATWVTHRSTWAREGYVYLEDLFVTDAARGKGVGRALIDAVADIARTKGAGRLYWFTDGPNTTAQALYDKIAERTSYLQYWKTL